MVEFDYNGIPMQVVASSDILSVGYRDGNLYVIFNTNVPYTYFDVPVSVYHALVAAESKGRFLNEAVAREGRYRYEKGISRPSRLKRLLRRIRKP